MTEQDKAGQDASRMDVAYVAKLARLALKDDEIRIFQGQLDEILGYVKKINELKLDGVEPTSHPYPIRNVFRKDEPRESMDRNLVMNNAPACSDGQFIVPAIIE